MKEIHYTGLHPCMAYRTGGQVSVGIVVMTRGLQITTDMESMRRNSVIAQRVRVTFAYYGREDGRGPEQYD